KIIEETPGLQLAAINDLMPPDDLAYLLKYDTAYGRYPKQVGHENHTLVVGEKRYPNFSEKDPTALPWKDLGIDLVFECTGVFDKRNELEKHLQAGARYVILSAPTKSKDIPTVVYGVNQVDRSERIVSCASCTTNCITPVVEIMGRRIGIKKSMMTTVHAYTASQGIVDGSSKKIRRGRAAAANFVPTTTGAAIATTKALPQYQGKFDGVAIRAPIPVGSIGDMVFLTERATSVEEVNSVFKEEAETERYREVLSVSDDLIVSSDIIKTPFASIVDLSLTQVVDGDMVKVMSWYDNEWGYAAQMVREALSLIQE
ncbi:MAG TPA: glyceraldehyde 3-phosphate dehydrogenase NAD-binding domain-containing protein, partial [Candidatus Binatia bacterium]|nr:glyceraldehyde 3-phosphate dehydrogenase NAD-binding domain-containing protein [Candidatus Binatia bacterium]